MPQVPLQVTEIKIGREGNNIAAYNDGSMVFSDRFNPLVRLSDLVAGSSASVQALTVSILTTDWIFDHTDTIFNRNFWKISVPIASVITNASKVTVSFNKVTLESPLTLEPVMLDNVTITESTVTIISSEQLNLYVSIKSI